MVNSSSNMEETMHQLVMRKLFPFRAKWRIIEKEKFSEDYLILGGEHFRLVYWLIPVRLSSSSII